MSARYAQVRKRNPKDREIPKFIEEQYQSLDENLKKKKDDELNGYHWLFFLFATILVILLTQYFHQSLPVPLEPNLDMPSSFLVNFFLENTRFSEIRAKHILHKLSNLGPKPSGSHACEEEAQKLILDELNEIKSIVEKGEHSLEIQTQYPSGCFDIQRFENDGFGICYKNVSNVIARLGSKKRPWHEEHSAALVNCHYDTWPTSPGGSDDLISCALMLELIRVLGEPNQPPVPHDIIFLFNGAEESALLAAHGFITQHPWRHAIKAFINLEASGSGGKELLFQAGPANQWLLNSYLEAAVHPHASIFGQEVFQSGVYPGDTDFRVFRDHGRIPGLDLAFVKNGYWYHTEFDSAERITNGSLQRAGENILSTLRHLLKSPYLEKPAEYGDKKFVFFDFYGLFTVVYSWETGLVLNYGTILGAIALVMWRLWNYRQGHLNSGYTLSHLHYGFLTHFLCASMMFLSLYALQLVYNSLNIRMAWYTNHWIVTPQYVVPLIFSGFLAYVFFVFKVIKRGDEKSLERSLHDANICINAMLLLVITYMGYASGFIFMVLALFPLLKDGVYCGIKKLLNLSDSIVLFSIFHIIYCLPGLLMVLYTVQMLLDIFIPIMGRTPANSEMTIGAFCAIICLFTSMSLSPLVLKTSKKALKNMLIFWFISILFAHIAVQIYGIPYHYDHAYPAARRTQLYHVRRNVEDSRGKTSINDAGLVVISQDNRGVLDIPYVSEPNSGFVEVDCSVEKKYCEHMPYYFPVRKRIPDNNIRFKRASKVLNFENPAKIILNDKKTIGNLTNYDLTLQGGGHLSFYLFPQNDYRINGWKLKNQEKFITNSTFGFFTCNGKNCGSWDVTLELEKIYPLSAKHEKELQLTIASHYLHGPDMQSTTLKDLLRKISQEREKSKNWKWAMTASAWNVDLVSKFL